MIITLTTDYGLQDHYVGALKGMIYSGYPEAKMVDITHQISPLVLHEAAYVVGASFQHFPEGSVHLVLVDAEFNSFKKPMLMVWKKHLFISADSGIFSLITQGEKPELVVALSFMQEQFSSQFYANTVVELAQGKSIFEMGEVVEQYKELQLIAPRVSEDQSTIVGKVIYIDAYGNTISNITKDLFDRIGQGREFEISFRNYSIKTIYPTYLSYSINQKPAFEQKMALFNDANYLEIALYRGNPRSGGTAASLLGIEFESSITVKFK